MKMGAHLNQALEQAPIGTLPTSKEIAYHRARKVINASISWLDV
jgi:hypothetical protein